MPSRLDLDREYPRSNHTAGTFTLMPLVGTLVTASIWSDLGGLVSGAGDVLNEVSASGWFLLVIAALAMFDSVFPILPSETAVIAGGVAAGQGHQSLVAVVVAAAIGAFLGDNTAYLAGHRFHGAVQRRADRTPKFAERLRWADDQIRRRGGSLLVAVRFIPGGRTAMTISCGLTAQPHRWFMRWTGVAAVVWALYAACLGFFFGNRFENNHTLAFVVAFGAALAMSAIIEGVRHLVDRGSEDGDAD